MKISAGFQFGDTLHFTSGAGINGTYNSATGVLTLTGAASLALYRAALRSITFSNATNDEPTAGGTAPTREISFEVDDGRPSNNVSATMTTTIDVTTINDVPVAGADNTSITEDASPNTVSGNVLANDSDADDATLTVTQRDLRSGSRVARPERRRLVRLHAR